jgi:hypothetical protein
MDIKKLSANHPASQLTRQRGSVLPYSASAVACPKCGSYSGKPCRSAKRKTLPQVHQQRIELAAGQYRAAARREISLRRHPFMSAFSPRRLANTNCFEVRIPERKAGERTSGDVESLTGPGRSR